MKKLAKVLIITIITSLFCIELYAKTPSDTLIIVGPEAPNILDIQVPGANVYAALVNITCYDRLITWGIKKAEGGSLSYDSDNIIPELAESWKVIDDGKSIIFKIRKNATFHDGSPVTANDVKWSLDRIVSIGGFPSTQMAAGGMSKSSQFVVEDDHTFRINFDKPNKLAIPDNGVPVPAVYNSKLAKKHSTSDDPWAQKYLSQNCAGGGAYKVESFEPSEKVVFKRFDNWKSGKLPRMKKVIFQKIENDSTRRALLEKGDVDLSIGLSKKDISDLSKLQNLKVESVAAVNSLIGIDLNTKMKPFNDVRVRRAIAHAIPYDKIISTAFHGYGKALTGHISGTPYKPFWPANSQYSFDLSKAKNLLKEAGYSNGFKTTISYDQGLEATRKPIALLVQESLSKIGIDAKVNNVPNANFMGELGKKKMPMVIAYFYAWLNYPEYFFFWNYHGGENSVHNAANYQNNLLDKIIEEAQYERDDIKYKALVSSMVNIVMADMPRIPITPVYLDVAMQNDIKGYAYWFHQMPDFRAIYK